MKTRKALFKTRLSIFLLMVTVNLLWAAQPTRAQSKGQAGAHFLLGFPQGEFKDHTDANGVGFSGEILYSPGSSLLGFGASLGYMVYGREKRREPFSTTIPDVEVDVITTNNLLLGHLLLRAQSKKGVFRPYADGLIGFSYLFTKTKIENVSGGEEVASSTNLDDWVFSYGGGGGLMIKVYTSPGKNGKRKIWSILIDLRLRYIFGGEAEYLKEGSIRREGGKVSYDITKSKTDLLTAQLGVMFEF